MKCLRKEPGARYDSAKGAGRRSATLHRRHEPSKAVARASSVASVVAPRTCRWSSSRPAHSCWSSSFAVQVDPRAAGPPAASGPAPAELVKPRRQLGKTSKRWSGSSALPTSCPATSRRSLPVVRTRMAAMEASAPPARDDEPHRLRHRPAAIALHEPTEALRCGSRQTARSPDIPDCTTPAQYNALGVPSKPSEEARRQGAKLGRKAPQELETEYQPAVRELEKSRGGSLIRQSIWRLIAFYRKQYELS